ncbi:MAG: GH92 family glycosyl hydrolase [Clostridia bacterium]|nr:GH92 family glycosyl hydrolase [Clostridia bacterium]
MKIRKKLDIFTDGEIKQSDSGITLDPTEYADLLFGVGSATSAGPTLPAGSIHPSPETLKTDCGGYLRNQPIVGFGHAYTSGAGGVKCYGNFLLCPITGAPELDRNRRASYAVSGTEKATCYEYSVQLENGIRARVTPAHSSAIYTLDFPAGSEATVLLDIAHKLDIDAAMKSGTVTVDPMGKSICGGGRFFGNWSGIEWDMYFALEFDTDFVELGSFCGDELQTLCPCSISSLSVENGKRFGVYIKFGSSDTEKRVRVKLSISFTGVEKAKEFLREQIPDFDYCKVRDSARSKWRGVLGAVELKTADTALLRRFYTAMYHLNVQPRDRTDDHGKWDDFHTLWDTWKTAFPLYALLYPQKMGAIVDSMIDRAEENQRLGNGIVIADEYVSAKEFPAGQGGNDADNVIVDAYLKGVPLEKHSWEKAYSVLLRSAEQMRTREYIENGLATDNKRTASGVPYSWRLRPAAATTGFALNDKAISLMAEELGTEEEAEKYRRRSSSWLNIWNPAVESEGFFGFPQSRNAEGKFDPGFDAHGGYNTHFYEATGWDAAYFNYNDAPRLIEAMGGAEKFTERLLWACEHSVNYTNDDNGKEGYLNFTNEPSFHIPWLFCVDEISRPDLAAKVISGIIARFSLQNDYPGDEDNGGMSSYYIFLMCGLFPFATTENYYLHGTGLERTILHLGNGRDLIITGENVSPDNIYVQSATWRGEPLNSCKLTHSQLMLGGELHFVMGAQPSDWARKK